MARGGNTVAQKRTKTNRGSYQSKKNPIRPLIWVTVAVIALFLIIGALSQFQQQQGPITFQETPSLEGQPIFGEADAPITVVEFGDYKCPSCKYWEEHIFPQLKSDYIDHGKVRYTFINTLFHGEESALASLAGETVLAEYPEYFWRFHHALFEAQPQSHSEQWVTVELLAELAETHIPNVDREQFIQLLTQKSAQPAVDVDNQLVEQYNVQLTPSIMVNNVMLPDPFDYEALRAAIEEQLEAVQ